MDTLALFTVPGSCFKDLSKNILKNIISQFCEHFVCVSCGHVSECVGKLFISQCKVLKAAGDELLASVHCCHCVGPARKLACP